MDNQNGKSASSANTSERKAAKITYAAQCAMCLKWWKIDTEEEYLEINRRAREDPYVCEDKEGRSCEDGGDLKFDSTRTWVSDTPGLPKIPRGFKRSLVLGNENSRIDDVYYIAPDGTKLRSHSETEAFLKANEEYKYASVEDFDFKLGKVMEDAVPSGISDTTSETSDTTSETSDTTSETSNTTSETSDTTSETSDTTSETSDTTSKTSDITSESSEEKN